METPNENEEASTDTNRRTLPATKLRFSSDSSRKSFCVFFPPQNISASIHLSGTTTITIKSKKICVAFDFY
jgi:valyl-tRNA synthetase